MQRLLRHGDLRSLFEIAWHRPKAVGRALLRAMRGKSKYPWPLLLAELRGTLSGPSHYLMEKIRRTLAGRRANALGAKRGADQHCATAETIAGSAPATGYDVPPRNPTNRAA
jgi:hypothetical protein